jgi:signal-transduction protein with cAMP-binding, CBS, and nucleotidyltransferase domain
MPATVRSVMSQQAVSVRAFTPYKQIVRTRLDYGISAVPVVDEAGRVQGVVSQADLIEKEAQQADGLAASHQPVTWRGRTARLKAHAVSAETLMCRRGPSRLAAGSRRRVSARVCETAFGRA